MDDAVLALALGDDGLLYAGGAFLSAGGAPNTARLARWAGAAWEGLSPDAQVDNVVRALVAGGGGVYAGGDFTSVTNNFTAGHAVGWDGSQWTFLGGPQSNGTSDCCVTALALGEDGTVFLGGSFSGVNRPVGPPLAAAGLAGFSAGAWSPLASGVDDAPAAMAVDGPDLYVGGAFRVAGGFASAYLGRWSEAVSYVGIDEASPEKAGYALSGVFPNPFYPNASFTLGLQATQHVHIAAYDALGRRVVVIFDGTVLGGESRTFQIEAEAWPSGTYWLRAIGESFAATRSLVLRK
jgi:hypothetical protein